MADAGLKIVIGADISKGVAGLNDVNKALSKTAKATNETTSAFGKVGNGTNQATNAITNLSRVAQDAPFGFIGIQNNLNPLLESFGRLKQETGSSSAALKSLVASLAGPAGVGLALGVVSAVMTVVIQKYGSLGNALDALTSSTSAAATAQRDISKAFAEAEGSAAGEIANINALLSVSRNETLSKQARAEAINKLNREYDAYLPKLTQENINTQAVTESVDKLTKSLIRQAQIKGLQDLISEETAKQAKLFAGSLGEQADWIDNIVASFKSLTPAGNFFNEQTIAGAKTIGKEYQAAQKRIEIFNKFLKQLTTEEAVAGTLFDEDKLKKDQDGLNKLLATLEQLEKIAEKNIGKTFADQFGNINLDRLNNETTKAVSLLNQIQDTKIKIAIRDAKISKVPANVLNEQIEEIKRDTQERINEVLNKEALALEFGLKLKFSQVNRIELPGNIDSVIAKATGLDKKIPIITLHEARVRILGVKLTEQIEFRESLEKKLQDEFNAIFSNLKIDAVASFAENIGNALVTGDIKNVFKGLFEVIAGGLQQFGKALVAFGVAQKAFQMATKSLNPALAIAAGAGLIIAGAALKASLPKFAEGGIVTGPVIGQIGEMHKPEVILPLDRLKALIGNGINNSNSGLQLIPIINNEGLYLAMKRGERSAGRKF